MLFLSTYFIKAKEIRLKHAPRTKLSTRILHLKVPTPPKNVHLGTNLQHTDFWGKHSMSDL